MKNILLPTDFSHLSDNTIDYALDSYRGMACTFHLFNISQAMDYTTSSLYSASSKESVYDTLLGEKQMNLERLRERLQEKYAEEDYRVELITGHDIFADAVNRVVEFNQIDLVCMGTNGVSGFQELILGSHALRVIRNVNAPVMIIPENFGFTGYQRIMITLNPGIKFRPEYIHSLFRTIGNRKVKLIFLRMTEDSKDADKELELELIENSIGKNEMEFKRSSNVSIVDAIGERLQELPVDLNLLPVKKELFLKRFVSGSLVSKVVNSTKVPLLVIPDEQFHQEIS